MLLKNWEQERNEAGFLTLSCSQCYCLRWKSQLSDLEQEGLRETLAFHLVACDQHWQQELWCLIRIALQCPQKSVAQRVQEVCLIKHPHNHLRQCVYNPCDQLTQSTSYLFVEYSPAELEQ